MRLAADDGLLNIQIRGLAGAAFHRRACSRGRQPMRLHPLSDDDLIREAREAFQLAADAEAENRREALDDLRFARLGEQWPEKVRRERELGCMSRSILVFAGRC